MPAEWTQNMRRKVYSRLLNEIGPHERWDAKIRPIWKRQQYDKILLELAIEFSSEVTAIQQQINFATTTQQEFKNRSHIRSFILNKAAAIEVGFITTSQLPNYLKISN
jgi:hypothetical protein